jgi:hypothetical protein
MSDSVDKALDAADALLQLQASVNGMIINLYWLLQRRSGVRAVTRMCDVRRYQDNMTHFETCVDVVTNRDISIDFWLEFGSENKRWHVEAQVLRAAQGDQDILEEFPEAPSPTNLAELERVVSDACDWLVNKGSAFDFDE